MKNKIKNSILVLEIIAIIFLVGYRVKADYTTVSDNVYYANKNQTVRTSLDELDKTLSTINSKGDASSSDILENKTLFVKGTLVYGAIRNYDGAVVESDN